MVPLQHFVFKMKKEIVPSMSMISFRKKKKKFLRLLKPNMTLVKSKYTKTIDFFNVKFYEIEGGWSLQ